MPPSWQIKPEKLLETARALVEHHAAQGHPKQSNLRRGVSTAYYAVFHRLSWGVTTHLLPDGRLAERLALARSIDHSAVKKVCQWVANPNSSPAHVRPIVTTIGANRSMVNIALIFLDLLEARHRADYDHLASFSKPSALAHIDAADTVLQSIDGVAQPVRGAFFALVALEVKKVQ